jgi:hypothetical protein
VAYVGEVLMDNREALIVDACVVPATGTGEREAATSLGRLPKGPPRSAATSRTTLGRSWRRCATWATPHVAQKQASAIDHRTTRRAGDGISQWLRKRIEEIFGRMKTWAGCGYNSSGCGIWRRRLADPGEVSIA